MHIAFNLYDKEFLLKCLMNMFFKFFIFVLRPALLKKCVFQSSSRTITVGQAYCSVVNIYNFYYKML